MLDITRRRGSQSEHIPFHDLTPHCIPFITQCVIPFFLTYTYILAMERNSIVRRNLCMRVCLYVCQKEGWEERQTDRKPNSKWWETNCLCQLLKAVETFLLWCKFIYGSANYRHLCISVFDVLNEADVISGQDGTSRCSDKQWRRTRMTSCCFTNLLNWIVDIGTGLKTDCKKMSE